MLPGMVPKYRGKCSSCGGERDRGKERLCKACHAVRQAEYRKRLRAKLKEREELLALVERLQGSKASDTYQETA